MCPKSKLHQIGGAEVQPRVEPKISTEATVDDCRFESKWNPRLRLLSIQLRDPTHTPFYALHKYSGLFDHFRHWEKLDWECYIRVLLKRGQFIYGPFHRTLADAWPFRIDQDANSPFRIGQDANLPFRIGQDAALKQTCSLTEWWTYKVSTLCRKKLITETIPRMLRLLQSLWRMRVSQFLVNNIPQSVQCQLQHFQSCFKSRAFVRITF